MSHLVGGWMSQGNGIYVVCPSLSSLQHYWAAAEEAMMVSSGIVFFRCGCETKSVRRHSQRERTVCGTAFSIYHYDILEASYVLGLLWSRV